MNIKIVALIVLCEEQIVLVRNRCKSKPLFGDLHLHPSSESTTKPRLTDALVTNSNVAASNDRFYGRIIKRSLALAYIRHRL